jgi:cytochrome P450
MVQTLLWGLAPGPFLRWCQRREGDMFTVRLPQGASMVVVAEPAAAKAVLALPAAAFRAAEAAPILEPFVGPRSLLLLDGERHRRQRQVMARALHQDTASDHAAIMAEAADRDLDSWPLGEAFAVRPHMQAVTTEVILRCVFGIERGEQFDRIATPLRAFLDALGSVLVLNPQWRRDLGPWSPWARFVALRSAVHEIVDGEIARRRAGGTSSRADVLSMLLDARDDENRGLDDLEVRDQLMTLVLAGHDTTATALAWAFDLLTHNPRVLDRCVASVKADDTAYLDAVVKEVLRLRPTIPDTGRTLSEPASIGGWNLPAGTSVTPSILLLHRRADLYTDPDAFRPERFLDPASSPTWVPFGGGVRRCLGATFATLEMRVVLRAVLTRMRVRPATRRPARARRRVVTLVPSTGGRIIAELV